MAAAPTIDSMLGLGLITNQNFVKDNLRDVMERNLKTLSDTMNADTRQNIDIQDRNAAFNTPNLSAIERNGAGNLVAIERTSAASISASDRNGAQNNSTVERIANQIQSAGESGVHANLNETVRTGNLISSAVSDLGHQNLATSERIGSILSANIDRVATAAATGLKDLQVQNAISSGDVKLYNSQLAQSLQTRMGDQFATTTRDFAKTESEIIKSENSLARLAASHYAS